mgnify:CR=1 FL=1
MLDLLVRNGTVVTAEGSYPYDVADPRGESGCHRPPRHPGGSQGDRGCRRQAGAAGAHRPHVHIHHPFKGSFAWGRFYLRHPLRRHLGA